ncbi:MAG TPA: hypothetical protein VH437_15365 [Terriglobales bacterium]
MLSAVLYVILFALIRTVRRMQTSKTRGLCSQCSFVHMQYGMRGHNAVFCTFGAVVRPVQIDVMYCTDYVDRGTPSRLVQIGFTTQPAAEA